MRNYGKVAPSFWIRGSGKKLRGHKDAQLLALYLMTGGGGNMCGVFYLPLPSMAHDTGLTVPEVLAALQKLAHPDIDVAHYDNESELVWVPGMAHWQVGPELKGGDKRKVAILDEVTKHGGHPFVAAFWTRYQAPYALGPMPQDRHTGVTNKPLPMPHDQTLPRPIGSQEQEQEQEQEQPRSVAPDQSGLQPPVDKPKRGGRAPRSLMKPDWQPTPDDAAKVTAAGLDVASVVPDFRDYWIAQGKLMADWSAAFRNNLAKILRTDWLKAQFALPPQALRLVGPSQSQPPPGPPAPAPPGVVEAMRNFGMGQRSPLLDPERRAVAGEPASFRDPQATPLASTSSSGVLGDPDAVTGVRTKPGPAAT